MFNNGFEYDDLMKYKRVFRNMDSMKSFIIASNVAELGYPTFSEQIPTAAVGIHPTTGRVEYMFNKEFYRSLSDEGLAFVIVHEMLHIAFDHPHRFKTILGKKHCDEFTEADQEKWKAFALAADCIVNTWCDHLGFPPPEDMRKRSIYPEVIGYPDFNSSTTMEDIYVWLMNQPKNILELTLKMDTVDSHDNWGDMDGPKGDQFKESVAGSIKDEFFIKVKKNVDADHMKKLKESDKDKKSEGKFKYNPSKYQSYGNQKKGELQHYKVLKDRVQLDVLRNIYDHIKKSLYTDAFRDNWSRPPKKLVEPWSRGDMYLPSEHHDVAKEKHDVLIVIDASGSITEEMKTQFVRWIRSFPLDKIDYTPISFDTDYYELDKKEFYNYNSYPKIYGGGGTSIDLCELYVQKVFKPKKNRRPDMVIVLTDGDGRCNFPIPKEHQHTYVWIMVKNGRMDEVQKYCPNGKFIQTNIQ